MSEKNSVPVRSRLRLFVALAAAVILATVAAVVLVLPGWRARQVAQVEEDLQPLTPQEVAEVKAAVEKQTGTPIRYVSESVEVWLMPSRTESRAVPLTVSRRLMRAGG